MTRVKWAEKYKGASLISNLSPDPANAFMIASAICPGGFQTTGLIGMER